MGFAVANDIILIFPFYFFGLRKDLVSLRIPQ